MKQWTPFSFIFDGKSSFSVTIESFCSSKGVAETIGKLQKLLRLRSKKDIKLHVEEVIQRGNQIKIGDKEYQLSDPDTRTEETIEEPEKADYNDLEDKVFRMELTYHEVAQIFDTKHIDAKATGYTFPTGIHEISDLNLTLRSLIPSDIKVKITTDYIRLRSSLSTN